MSSPINFAKDLFLLEEGITYLNCANMSPMLRSVREAGLQALDTRATPWKLSSQDWFTGGEELRELAAKVFQTSGDNIALIPSVSYGLAVAAKNLKPETGKEIIILEEQFPSNYYVWENLAQERGLKIVVVQKSKDKTFTESILEKINNNTGIIAIPNCHWTDGIWIDLQQISDAARSVSSYLILDLSQSLGVLPIDIDHIQPDFAVAVGYKWMLGPYGLGYMYVSKKWQESGEPLEYSWLTKKGSEDFTALSNYVTGYRKGARKFDMGEFPQFNILPMAIAALKQILDWGVNNIQADIKGLTDKINNYKKDVGIFNSNQLNAGHMISISLENFDGQKIKQRLQENKVIISFRGKFIRVAPHVYNDSSDIDKLLSCF